MPPKRRFQLILIKPSHYDDDGYVIRWARSFIPSNSLACLYALALDCQKRQVLGSEVALDIVAVDETNARVKTDAIVGRIRKQGGFGMVALVGVQSNQYPRAIDLSRRFRAADVAVVIGGFHVSGCLAMLPRWEVDLRLALDIGVSLFAGEAEGRFETVLRDAAAGALRPLYDFLGDGPSLDRAPTPYLPAQYVRRTIGWCTTFDAGRGCPFQCSFCTIINVQGRKSRYRSPDDVEALIRENVAQGIYSYFITDDDFARNKSWEAILDRIISLRERDGLAVNLIIQVDAQCHKIPNFIRKCKRAGVERVFIGLENINPDNLLSAKKRQNKVSDYKRMLLAWREQAIITQAGYILGFPHDTPERIARDIRIIQEELPVDILEFFLLTPLPGSEDHQKLWQANVAMDPDLNKCDLEHAVAGHPRMTPAELQRVYLEAWSLYYTPRHLETILRRAAASGIDTWGMLHNLVFFSAFVSLERVHPLQGGIFRRKSRLDRRPGAPIEPALVFYPKTIQETLSRAVKLIIAAAKLNLVRRRIESDPSRRSYRDKALTPAADDPIGWGSAHVQKTSSAIESVL